MTPDPTTCARKIVEAWRDRDIQLDELLAEPSNQWLVESLVSSIAAALAERDAALGQG